MAVPIRVLRRVEGPRSTVEVFERGDWLGLRFAGGGGLIQGRMHRRRPLDFGAVHLPLLCAPGLAVPTPRHALCLGLGIGAVPRLLRALWPGLRVDAVEIDPTVVEVARRDFGLVPGPGLAVHVADALDFVRHPPPGPPYDLVVLDCFDGEALPAPLAGPAFVRAALALLGPGGVLAVNLIVGRAGAAPILAAMRGALAAVCLAAPPSGSNRVCSGSPHGPLDLRAMAHRAQALAGRTPLDLVAAVRATRALAARSAVRRG